MMDEPMEIRGPWRWIRRIVIAGVTAAAFWSLLIMIFEERFIFFPAVYPDGLYEEQRSLNAEDHMFRTEDGLTLHGWFIKTDAPLATILMFHGNAGNLSHRGEILRRLRSAGFNIFIPDYRGYGKSEGSPTEEGVYRDGRAAAEYVRSLGGVDTSRILYFGSSLGGAVAVDAAIHRSPAGLILESTFSSARDVAAAVYPFLPVQFLLRSRFDSESKIGRLRCPLLFLHGTDDTIIPLKLGRKLFDAAPHPKEFHEIRGAGHNNVMIIAGPAFPELVRSFVERLFGNAAP